MGEWGHAAAALDSLLKAGWKDITAETWPVMTLGLRKVQELCQMADEGQKKQIQGQVAHFEGQVPGDRRRNAAVGPIQGPLPEGASWAARAARAGPAPVAKAGVESEGRAAASRKARTVTIRLGKAEEKDKAAKASPLQLVKAFKVVEEPLTEQIVAARRLYSGDVLLDVATMEAREGLEKAKGWANKGEYQTAKVLRQSFTVAVDGVCLARFSDTEKESTMRRMERENVVLHPGLEIVDCKLPPVAKRPDSLGRAKRTSTVILSVASTGMHDGILDRGITEGGSMKQARPWDRAADICQYFNCQGYGHITTRCTNKTKCAVCAEGHNTHEHKGLVTRGLAKDQLCCAACGRNGHPAWDVCCSIRAKETRRKELRIAHKVTRYSLCGGQTTGPPKPILRRVQSLPDREGWVEAGNGKKRKIEAPAVSRPGRPTAVTTAAKKAGQKTLNFKRRAPPARMDGVETNAEIPEDIDI